MRYVAAYLLAALGGKDSPNSADIEKIISLLVLKQKERN
jgi:ribosomal protein L12E/L44/L45/RPP1/RPP2